MCLLCVLQSFVDNGGWNFLDMEANDSEEEGSDSFDEGMSDPIFLFAPFFPFYPSAYCH